jgi:hypothetical protein
MLLSQAVVAEACLEVQLRLDQAKTAPTAD